MINLSEILENIITDILKDNNYKFCPLKFIKSRLIEYDYTLNNIVQVAKINNVQIQNVIDLLVLHLKDNSAIEMFAINNFLNFKIKNSFLVKISNDYLNNSNISNNINNKLKIIVDYSSPNIAKDMHVGHLRSTIIGDCIANFYQLQGHNVQRINHIGDFGLPFGMIIQYIINYNLQNDIYNLNLQDIYKSSRELYEKNNDFKKEAYTRTVELQKDLSDNTIQIWKKICEASKKSYEQIYKKLNINLIEKGESFYKFMFDDLVCELKEKNRLLEDNGRHILLTPIENQNDIPLTIIKSDGGYTYDTTDLCALKYRLTVDKADKIFYVVDSGQSIHFKQIFHAANLLNWKSNNQTIEHINFGVVLGTDKKRLKSRNGDNPKLIDLINESFEKTVNVINNHFNTNDNNLNKKKLVKYNYDNNYIEKLAYGSLKYFDLSLNRTSDYVFNFDKMINFKGNTLMFVMYSYIRANSILKKINNDFPSVIIENELTDKDYNLLKCLFRIQELNQQFINSHNPHIFCDYLFQLSEIIHNSYKTLKCIMVDTLGNILSINFSRANIYKICIQIIKYCFDILGITPVDYI